MVTGRKIINRVVKEPVITADGMMVEERIAHDGMG